MILKQVTGGKIDLQALLEGDQNYLRSMVSAIVEATPEAEMTAAPGGRRASGPWVGQVTVRAATRARW